MLIVIEKENDVKKAQKQLERKMNGVAEKHGTILMGGKGWHTDREVNWNSDLGIWWTTEEEKDRYWNSFGTGEPKWNIRYPHSITCEINLFKGKYRRTQGAVAMKTANYTCYTEEELVEEEKESARLCLWRTLMANGKQSGMEIQQYRWH